MAYELFVNAFLHACLFDTSPLIQTHSPSYTHDFVRLLLQESAQAKVARLYQRARLVQLAALELHCADLAVQDASCKHLLDALFMPFDTDTDTGDAWSSMSIT